ncbi:MAG: hypothetical protein VX000_04055 [Myxococcota bacterium]|nr:hypothetical protein [Myxococcota bacterium]
MHLALVLAVTLSATADERPRAADRKALRLHQEARQAWVRCAGARKTGREPEQPCLEAYLAQYENAKVRVRGQDWPADVPDVPAARERLDSLLLDAEEARMRAAASLSWEALADRLQAPGEAEITALRGWIERWSGAVALAGAARRPFQPAELVAARDALPGVVLRARSTTMAAGPWNRPPAAVPAQTAAPRLRQRSAKKNSVIDDGRWFRDVGWTLPVVLQGPSGRHARIPTLPGEQAAFVPRELDGAPLRVVIVDENHRLGVYGAGAVRERLGVFAADTGELLRSFDFSAWTRAPQARRGEEAFVDQSLTWAQIRHGVLYVSHAHRTHAASSMGQNAYLSAIDLKSGLLLWRSPPLVCNSHNFIIQDDHIWCGYGFTAEPDFITLLDRQSGDLVSKTRLKTGPDYLLLRDNRLYVRTYDTDYVFDIE